MHIRSSSGTARARAVIVVALILLANAAMAGCFRRDPADTNSHAEDPETDPVPVENVDPGGANPTPGPSGAGNASAPAPQAAFRIARLVNVSASVVPAVQLAVARADSLDAYALVYRVRGTGDDPAHLRFDRVDADGTVRQGARVPLVRGALAAPTIAWNPTAGDGSFLAVWVEEPSLDAGGALRVLRLDANLDAMGAALDLAAPATGRPAITTHAGDFMIAYRVPDEAAPTTVRVLHVAVEPSIHPASEPRTLEADRARSVAAIPGAAGFMTVSGANGTFHARLHLLEGDALAVSDAGNVDTMDAHVARTVDEFVIASGARLQHGTRENGWANETMAGRIDALVCLDGGCVAAAVVHEGTGRTILEELLVAAPHGGRAHVPWLASYASPRDIRIDAAGSGSEALACAAGTSRGAGVSCAMIRWNP